MLSKKSLSEELCSYIFDQLPGMFFRADADHQLLEVSRQSETLTGYSPGELIKTDTVCFADLVFPEDLPSLLKRFAETSANTSVVSTTYRITGKKGRITQVHEIALGRFNAEGIYQYTDGYLTAVTGQEDYNSVVQTLQAYQDAVNEGSIVSITDKRGIITFANKKFTDISRYALSELVGNTHRLINSGFHSKEFSHLYTPRDK